MNKIDILNVIVAYQYGLDPSVDYKAIKACQDLRKLFGDKTLE